MEGDFPYEDIVNRAHPVSAKHPPMPRKNRAAQFAPFAALTGYEAVIEETGRFTDDMADLAEDRAAYLDERLAELRGCLADRPAVTLTFFAPDEKKAGGAYRTLTGTVRKIDEFARTLNLEDGTAVPVRYLMDITW